MNEHDQFVDAENQYGEKKGSKTYEQIVLEQLERIVREGSKELRGGYHRQDPKGGGVPAYVEDQLEIYTKSIDSLYDLLLPFFDDEMIIHSKNFNEQVTNIRNKINQMIKKQIEVTKDIRVKQKLQESLDTGFIEKDSYAAAISKEMKYLTYRRLYQELILLFNRKKYLMAEAIME